MPTSTADCLPDILGHMTGKAISRAARAANALCWLLALPMACGMQKGAANGSAAGSATGGASSAGNSAMISSGSSGVPMAGRSADGGGGVSAAGGTNMGGSNAGASNAGASNAGGSNASGSNTSGSNASGSAGAAAGSPAGGAGASPGSGGAATGTNPSVIAAGVRWVGRVDLSNAAQPRFGWSGTGFMAAFNGTGLSVSLNTSSPLVFKPVVDGTPRPVFTTSAGTAVYAVASGLAAGAHTVALYRQSEGQQGNSELTAITVAGGALSAPPPAPNRLIEVIGDSISCGYGNLGTSATCTFSIATESHWDSYEAVAARALNADLSTIAISGRGMYRNNDGTTATIMPAVYDRVLPNSASPMTTFSAQPEAVLVNLGTNDFALGDPGSGYAMAYLAFVRVLRMRYPNAWIICLIGPMVNDGFPAGAMALTRLRNYTASVISTRHGEGDTKVDSLEFSAQGTTDYGCDYHPNQGKHQQMGLALTAFLKTKLGW